MTKCLYLSARPNESEGRKCPVAEKGQGQGGSPEVHEVPLYELVVLAGDRKQILMTVEYLRLDRH